MRTTLHLVLLALGLLRDSGDAFGSVWPGPSAPEPGDLVINEFHPWPESPLPEYIEILNRSTRTVHLVDLGIADDRLFTSGASAVRSVPLPPGGLSLAPGDYLVLAENLARFHAAYAEIPAIEVPGWPVLNNGGDSVVLLSDGAVLDAVTYTGSWRKGVAAMERVDPSAPSDTPDNWVASSDPSGGTPGRRNSGFDPDVSPPVLLFAEQESGTSVRIRFNEPVRVTGSSPLSFSTEPDVPCTAAEPMVDPREFRFRCDNLEEVQIVRVHAVEDRVGNRMADTTVVLARIPGPGDLVINEILYDPLADEYDGLPNQTEFVEVASTSPRTLTVRPCALVDEPDEKGNSTAIPFAVDYSVLNAGSFGVLVADPTAEDPHTSPLLDAAFPDRTAMEGAPTWAVSRSGLGLSNVGESIRVVCAGLVVDSVFYTPAWHSPALGEPKGRSLERRSPAGPSNVSWNWSTSTADAGATPGAPNTVRATAPERAGQGRRRSRAVLFTPDGDGLDDVAVLPVPFGEDGLLLRAIVFDARGRPIRILESGRFSGAGSHLIWDGRDDSGREAVTGPYVVWMEAINARTGRVHADRAVVVLSRSVGH